MTDVDKSRLPISALQALPPVWPESLLESIAAHRRGIQRCLVVLDDDPLAGQSLYDVPVLTRSDVSSLAVEIGRSNVFVLLTDTRSISRDEARDLMRKLGGNLRNASKKAGREVDVAMRGDSTLRGHFPRDFEALTRTLLDGKGPKPVCVLAPYFGEAGRITLDNTQYAVDGDSLVPVSETEYARDPVFRYVDSHLPSWLMTRANKRITANQVMNIGIGDLREGGPAVAATRAGAVVDGRYLIANAADDRDLEVVGHAIAALEADGRRFVTWSAAPFLRIRLGMPTRELLTAEEVIGDATTTAGGLVIVGSYVERTREQLDRALAREGVTGIEMDVEDSIYNARVMVKERVSEVDRALAKGNDVVLYLGQGKLPKRAGKALSDGQRLSETISKIVARLRMRPRYVLVKGGNTASSVAKDGLNVRRAMILGQLMPGVPAWRTAEESKWPGLPFVIFPGNVGDADSLSEAIEKLSGESSQSQE
jgi:uncharacterized protein YgbK (DUF1537 family)